MEDIGAFGPSVVVAVGIDDSNVEQLQEECSARKMRLIVANRQSDLPISVQCDVAIVGALLPDADGRKLAADFVDNGANVMIIDNAGPVALADAWVLGAVAAPAGSGASDWLDQLANQEHVEAVTRAGRLMEAPRLAESVAAAASFSGATGIPVSFVRIRPDNDGNTGQDDALDRLTSVVGMTTVFYDSPAGERLALVVNGDRRRLVRLLDDARSTSEVRISVIEVSPKDDLFALIGRSSLSFRGKRDEDDRPRVLVALGQGQDKIAETLRAALHRMDFTPLFWDAAFRFEDVRANPPVAVITDAGMDDQTAVEIAEGALDQTGPIPVVCIAGDEAVRDLRSVLDAGASDFLVWPFSPGDVQAALARAVTIGRDLLESAQAARVAASEKEAAELEPQETPLEEREPDDAVETEAPVADVDEAPKTIPVAGEDDVPETDSAIPWDEVERESESPSQDPLGDKDSHSVETALAEIIGGRLIAGESVKFEGLGVLSVRHETSRIVHDERGRTIVEPPKRTLTFDAADSDSDEDTAS